MGHTDLRQAAKGHRLDGVRIVRRGRRNIRWLVESFLEEVAFVRRPE